MSIEKTLLNRYLLARHIVESQGYGWEIAWQESRDSSQITETEFLREAAWVILCSGFRESTIRKIFCYISLCFCDFESARAITQSSENCIRTSMLRFRNESKLRAIAKLAMAVASDGFQKVRTRLQIDPTSYLTQFSYLGEITACHLAKSLGFPFSKPDRHLQRIAQNWGYGDRVDELCEEISRQSGDKVSVVDLVLWRAAVLTQPQTPKRQALLNVCLEASYVKTS